MHLRQLRAVASSDATATLIDASITALLYQSFIYSGHFYSASSSPQLHVLRSGPDTAGTLCRSFTPKRHRQLRVKDLPKVPTWRLERDYNSRPSGRKASTLPMRHHVPHNTTLLFFTLCWPHNLAGNGRNPSGQITSDKALLDKPPD